MNLQPDTSFDELELDAACYSAQKLSEILEYLYENTIGIQKIQELSSSLVNDVISTIGTAVPTNGIQEFGDSEDDEDTQQLNDALGDLLDLY